MPIDVSTITSAELEVLLDQDEGHFIDFKSRDISPAKLTKTISAFANTDGGDVYIGIEEDKPNDTKHWRGFANQEAANGHLQIFEQLFPLGSDFQYEFMRLEGSEDYVLHVNVVKTPDIKVASNDIPYIRRGAASLPVDTIEKRKRLEYEKGISSFENMPVNVEPELIFESAPTQRLTRYIVPAAEPEAWLKKQRLIVNDLPIVAGVLLLTDEPQAIIPKHCGIKVYRYKTTDTEGSRASLDFDPITIEGCLYDQIRAAVVSVTEVIEGIKILGEKGLEAVIYPNEALHEIITNAVIHRDYSIADDVHIRIFDNRVEVQSPGRLPAHITPANILDERFARNGKIVRLLNKFPSAPNKDVGEGLNTAFSAMTNLGLREPVITEKDNAVLVILRHEKLASPETVVLQYLDEHDTINNSEARSITHITADYRVKALFNRLVARGLIEQVPGTYRSTTRYRKTSKDA